jgi:hypothetical protein
MKSTTASQTRTTVALTSLIALGLAVAIPAMAAKNPAAICATAKQKAAAKKLTMKVMCHGKAIKKGEPVDATCLMKAETKFNESFTKAEAKGGCTTIGDTADIEMLIDTTLADLLEALPGTTTTTSTTSTTVP